MGHSSGSAWATHPRRVESAGSEVYNAAKGPGENAVIPGAVNSNLGIWALDRDCFANGLTENRSKRSIVKGASQPEGRWSAGTLDSMVARRVSQAVRLSVRSASTHDLILITGALTSRSL